MEGWSDEDLRVWQAFFPYAAQKTLAMGERNGRFVHYTSARVAMSILQRKEVWMRQATTMNDFSEIQYGLSRLAEAYKSDVGNDFRALIESMFPGVCDEIARKFDGWELSFRLETYLTCISEHQDNEDMTGRLSMWRAYGGQNSVAIVMNNGPFLRPSQAINAFTSPVNYSSSAQFISNFRQVVEGIKSCRDIIAALDRETVAHNIFEMFRFAALCTKHPGFHEEREWRIIYSPKLFESDKLIYEIQDVGGVPQRIYKMPLKNYPEEGFTGAEPNELVDRIIIGPTQFPYATAEAFVELLGKAGVSEPNKKVFVSDIPLRR